MAISACMFPGVQMSIRSMSSRSISAAPVGLGDGEPEPFRRGAHGGGVPAGDPVSSGSAAGRRTVGVPPCLGVRSPHEGVPDHSDPQRLLAHHTSPDLSARPVPPGRRWPSTSSTDDQDAERRGSSSRSAARAFVRILEQVASAPAAGSAERTAASTIARLSTLVWTSPFGTLPVAPHGDELGQGPAICSGPGHSAGIGVPSAVSATGRCRRPRPRCRRAADPPAAVPRCLQTGAAPAAGENRVPSANSRYLGGGVAGEPTPARVERLAVDPHGFAADQVAGEVEMVDRHVDQQRIGHLLPEAAEVRPTEEAAIDVSEPPSRRTILRRASGCASSGATARHQKAVGHLGGRGHRQSRARRLGQRLLARHGSPPRKATVLTAPASPRSSL